MELQLGTLSTPNPTSATTATAPASVTTAASGVGIAAHPSVSSLPFGGAKIAVHYIAILVFINIYIII
jgi:hypothetical protein